MAAYGHLLPQGEKESKQRSHVLVYVARRNTLAHPGPASAQEHLIGPVLTGAYNFSPYGKLKYEVGYLWGLTPASGRSAIRWRLEYEIAF